MISFLSEETSCYLLTGSSLSPSLLQEHQSPSVRAVPEVEELLCEVAEEEEVHREVEVDSHQVDGAVPEGVGSPEEAASVLGVAEVLLEEERGSRWYLSGWFTWRYGSHCTKRNWLPINSKHLREWTRTV